MSSAHSMDSSAVEMARMVGVPGLASDEEENEDVENASTRGLPRPRRARRLQNAIRDIVREHYLCFVLVWLLLVLALAIATFVTFIELLVLLAHTIQARILHVFFRKCQYISPTWFWICNCVHECIILWISSVNDICA